MAADFRIAEFVAHDPRLQFRSLKSRLGQRHQPNGRCVTNALNLLPLSVHSGHGRTCCWHDPVANDPNRKSRSREWGDGERVGGNGKIIGLRNLDFSDNGALMDAELLG